MIAGSLNGPELWKLYMTLLRAEQGFSALKGALGLRPNFHQLEGRVEGHIFISVLPYHLCGGWGIGSRKAATCGTGKPCADFCAPTAW